MEWVAADLINDDYLVLGQFGVSSEHSQQDPLCEKGDLGAAAGCGVKPHFVRYIIPVLVEGLKGNPTQTHATVTRGTIVSMSSTATKSLVHCIIARALFVRKHDTLVPSCLTAVCLCRATRVDKLSQQSDKASSMTRMIHSGSGTAPSAEGNGRDPSRLSACHMAVSSFQEELRELR